jgi:hypothetical protein
MLSTKFMADKQEATHSLLCFQNLFRTVVLASRKVKNNNNNNKIKFREDYHVPSSLAEKEGEEKGKQEDP